MVIKDNAFVFGGDWRIPVKHQLLDSNFVEELRQDGTYNENSFAREYESIWSGTSEDAFFNADLIDRHRTLEKPETEPDSRNKKAFYIISADVARMSGNQNADTVAMVFKIIPRDNGAYHKQIVHIHVFNGEHFELQSIRLKKLVFHYNARMLIVDANGLGVGLVDFLIKENINDQGELFVPFNVTNDDDYNKYKTDKSLPLLYNVKANSSNASQIHVNCLSQISSGRVKFLIDEMTAKAKLLSNKKNKDMPSEEVAKFLAPFITTSIMKDEMLNLQQKQEGKTIKLERINRKIGKDKFSSLEYGLWYIKTLEDKNITRREQVNDLSQFMMIKTPKY